MLWVGTRMGGVHKWNPLSWQFGHVAPEPDNPNGLGGGRVTSFSRGPRRAPVDRHLRRRPLRDGPRRAGDMTAYRHDAREPAQPAQRPGDGAAPRPPRRPLDRHPRRRPGADERAPPAPSSPTATIPKKPEGLSAQGRDLDPRGRRRPPLARHLRRRPRALRPRDRALHALPPRSQGRRQPQRRPRGRPWPRRRDGRLWVATMENGPEPPRPAHRPLRAVRASRRATPTQPARPTPCTRCTWTSRAALWVGTHSGLSHLQPDGQVLQDLHHAQRPAQRRRLRHRATTGRAGCG